MISFALFSVALCEIKFSKMQWLLPFKDELSSTNPYIIIESEGHSCVEYESASPGLLKVSALNPSDKCIKSAKIEVLTPGVERQAGTIIASSGSETQQLTIYINKVSKLDFKSSTKSIFLESSPRTFDVIGYDSNGNTFDSLEGLKIKFEIDAEHLRIEQPKQINLVQLDSSITCIGMNVGLSWITASYSHMTAKINLNVIEPIGIFPGPLLHVFPNTSINFKICTTSGLNSQNLQHKCVHEVPKSDYEKYNILISDKSLLHIDNELKVTAKRLGVATITVSPKDSPDNTVQTIIKILYPKFTKKSGQYIALGTEPKFNPIFYATDQRQMDIFQPIPFYVKSGSWNKEGRHSITLSYMNYDWQAIVIVCEPIKCNPSDPILPVGGSIAINISGGSGSFECKSMNSNIIKIFGQKITAQNVGLTTILISDKLIPELKLNVSVIVDEIVQSKTLISQTEIISGSAVDISCEFYTSSGKEFSIPIEYSILSSNERVIPSKSYNNIKEMKSFNSGFTELSCKAGSYSSAPKLISIIKPLIVLESGEAAPNSSIPIKIIDGPQKWPNGKPPKVSIICSNAQTQFFSNNNTFKINQTYNGKCTAKIVNEISSLNQRPVSMSADFPLKVSNITSYVISVSGSDFSQDAKCKSPFLSIGPKFKSEYNIPIGKHISIHSFALNSKNNVIHHHDGYQESILINGIEQIPTQNITRGDIYVDYIPKEGPIAIKSVGPKGSSTSTIKIYEPLTMEASKVEYITGSPNTLNITGGSGYYILKNGDASIKNSQLFARIPTRGQYKFTVSDMCIPEEEVSRTITTVMLDELEIDAPDDVSLSSPFTVKIIPKSQGFKIDQKFYNKTGISFEPSDSEQIGPLEYSITPKRSGSLVISAKAVNGVIKKKTIQVLTDIVFRPKEIVLLPGETAEIFKVSGPDKLKFSYDQNSLALTKEAITAVRSGIFNIEISSDTKYLTPFIITVRVPKPLKLSIDTLVDDGFVKGGLVALKASLQTDMGNHPLESVDWVIPDNLEYEYQGDSRVIINLTSSGPLNVNANAYGLHASFSRDVEPILKFEHSNLLMAPLSRLELNPIDAMEVSYSILPFQSSVSISDNVIKSSSNEEIVYVEASSKYQQVVIVINIKKPSAVILHHKSYEDYNIELIDNRGVVFNSKEDIVFDLKPLSGELKNIKVKGSNVKIHNLPETELNVEVSASNEAFKTSSIAVLSDSAGITPSDFYLTVGSGVQMKASSIKRPTWTVNNSNVVSITANGYLSAKEAGFGRVSITKTSSTAVTVVKIIDYKLVQKTDCLEIVPVFDINGLDTKKVIGANQFSIKASISSGTVSVVQNKSTSIVNYFISSSTATLNLEMTSKSGTISKKITVGKRAAKFGIKDGHLVQLSSKSQFNTIGLTLPNDDIIIRNVCEGVTVKFLDKGGIIVSAKEPFENGHFILEHRPTGEKVRVLVRWSYLNQSFEKRPVKYYIKLILSIIVMFVSAMVLLVQLQIM